MALEDLTPAVRVEAILDGADIDPATRLEYFMKKAANEVPKPAGSADAGKVVTVNSDGDGFILNEVDPGLPDIAGVSDAGKVVTVNSAGSAYELATPSGGGGITLVEQTLPISVKWGNSTNEIYSVIPFICDYNGVLNQDYNAIVLPDAEYAKLTGHYGLAGFSPDGSVYTAAPVTDWVTPWTVDAPTDTSSLSGMDWVQPITSVGIRYVVSYYNTSNQAWENLVLVKASEVEYDSIDT